MTEQRQATLSFARAVLLVLLWTVLLPVAGSVMATALIPEWRWDNVPFHAAVGAIGGLFALALAAILLAAWTPGVNRHHLWVIVALVGTGTLDIAHAAVAPGQLFVWFHSAATFVGGVFFAMVWLPARITNALRCRLVVPLTGVAMLALCVCSLGLPNVLPAMVDHGNFTTAARGLDVAGSVGFLAAAAWFIRRCRVTQSWDDCLFACLCGLFGTAGGLFEHSSLWDATWWWWHLLHLGTYGLVVAHFLVAYKRTSWQLQCEIDKRRQAETALQTERQQLTAMFDGMEETVYVSDPETYDLLYLNDACTKRWGHRAGEKCYRVLQNRDAPCPFCTNDRIFGENTGKPYIWEFQNEVTRRWHRCFDRAIRWSDGRMVRFELAVDIHEAKQIQEERQMDTQRMKALLGLNQMADAPLREITDFVLEEAVRLTGSEIGYLAFLNDDESALTMHSWSRTAMEQCRVVEKPLTYHVEETGLWGEAVRQRKAIITNDYAAENTAKKGTPEGHVPVKRHMNVPIFSGSHIVLVAGVGNKVGEYDHEDAQQVTLLMEGMWSLIERKRVEGELRESEGRARAILDSVQAGVVLIDAETRRIVQANPAVCAMFGASEEQIVGQECHKHVCSAEAGSCPVTDLGQQVHNSECVLHRADGTPVPVLKTVSRVVLGDREHLLESFVDISDRKQIEDELTLRITEVSEAKHRLEVLVSGTVEREQRMVDLKQEVNDLLEVLGRRRKYEAPERVANMSMAVGGD